MAPADQAAAVMDVLAEARAEADSIRRQALEEGYAAGRREALEALAPALAALGAATDEVRASQASAAAELERRAVELGLALAPKVAGRCVVASSPSGCWTRSRARCAGSSSASASSSWSTRRISRSCKGAAEELKATLGGIEHCVIEAERRVGRGGVHRAHARG